MKRDVREHRHILRRATKVTFACIDDCSFRETKAYLLGRIVRCPFCQSEFQLTKEDLKRALPRCPRCSNTKENRVTNELTSLFQDSPSENPTEEQLNLEESVDPALMEVTQKDDDPNLEEKVGF